MRVYYMAVPPFLYSRICRTSKRAVCVNKRAEIVLFWRSRWERRSVVRVALSRTRISTAGGRGLPHRPLPRERISDECPCFAVCERNFRGSVVGGRVERVEICCLEEVDCEGRGGYFDAYGIIRDVMQNHLAQLLALVAMEQPFSRKADDVRREKVRALRACKVLDSRDVIRGQYDGYADDSSITNKKTTTETFAACKLFVDTSLSTREFASSSRGVDAARQVRARVTAQAALGRRPVHPDRGQGPPGEEGRGAHCVSRGALSGSGVAEVLAATNLWYVCNRTNGSIGASRTKSPGLEKSSKWNRGA